MATSDLLIIDGDVEYGDYPASLTTRKIQLGETVARMVPVYYDETTNRWLTCVSTNSAKYAAQALTFTSGVAGEWVEAVTSGKVVVGASLSKGRRYVVSSVSGKIMLDSDLTTGDYPHTLGFAHSTTELDVMLISHGGIML